MKLFNKLILTLFLTSLLIGAKAQTTVPQTISSNQTWTAAGSPYIVNQNVLIKAGSTVKVMPGTKIRATGKFKIIVEGGFEARGNKDSVVVIDTVSFEFLKVANGYNFSTNTGSVFSYCLFNGAGMDVFQTIYFNGGTPLLISNCKFLNTFYTLYCVSTRTDTIKIRIEKTIFDGTKTMGYGSVINPSGNAIILEMDECIVKTTNGMYLGNTSIITRCLFYDWKSASGFRVGNGIKSATFKCNVFKKFAGSIIELSIVSPKTEVVIVSNTFDTADYHIDYKVFGTRPAKFVVKNNNFLSFRKNSVHVTGGSTPGYADTLVFTKNYWGTTTASQIASSIWDINDDIAVAGLVDYASYHTALQTDCIEDETAESYIGSSGTGSVKNINNIGFNAYPNPANNFVSIQSMHSLKSWKIYNITGELVALGNFSGSDNLIDVTTIKTGFYLLEVSNGDALSGKQKLVINR